MRRLRMYACLANPPFLIFSFLSRHFPFPYARSTGGAPSRRRQEPSTFSHICGKNLVGERRFLFLFSAGAQRAAKVTVDPSPSLMQLRYPKRERTGVRHVVWDPCGEKTRWNRGSSLALLTGFGLRRDYGQAFFGFGAPCPGTFFFFFFRFLRPRGFTVICEITCDGIFEIQCSVFEGARGPSLTTRHAVKWAKLTAALAFLLIHYFRIERGRRVRLD